MPCYHPIKGWRSRYVNPDTGKRPIVFDVKQGYSDLPVTVPCGQCIGCRLEYSRQWAIRCVHEAMMHDRSSFITLTYADEHLPIDRCVSVEILQKFFKRFRKDIAPIRIRFFACGEYGDERQRPHYHACIFGYDFPDKIHVGFNKRGDELFSSPLLTKSWPYGMNWIGQVTFESCAYVARYMLKKQKGIKNEFYEVVDQNTGEIEFRTNQFATMSRGSGKDKDKGTPYYNGLGAHWYEMYGESDTKKDFITLRGMKMKLPKFYDMLNERNNPLAFEEVKVERKKNAYLNREDNTPRRLNDKESVKKAQLKFLKRNKE